MAAAAAAIVLCEDDRGIPRSLPLLDALVEEDARLHAAAASQPAGNDLVRAFRGRTVPKVPIRDFLERIYVLVRSEAATGQVIRVDGTCFVLAGVYLTRFIGSHAARVAGIVVEPSTAHRLVAVALFLGGHSPKNWAAVFEAASDRAIRTGEIAGLEERFLRAISSRLFVDGHEFKCFCGVLEKVPLPPLGSCASKKRRADAVTGDEEEEHRRVRACVPPPAAQRFEKKTVESRGWRLKYTVHKVFSFCSAARHRDPKWSFRFGQLLVARASQGCLTIRAAVSSLEEFIY
ncbi:unnamed protein product [Miscanthus lutarioriparius]|uniref:Uncharacterized protein n=1 Tax=Miscanthus lutarioriparius TaxID=422564 RepID=A0A811NBR8_9POAL|nr:unnamed protein product [Miscanthus lutarioriparius]